MSEQLVEQMQESEVQQPKVLLFDLDGVLVYSRARNIAFYTYIFDFAADFFEAPELRSQTPEDITECFPLGLEDAITRLTPVQHQDKIPSLLNAVRFKDNEGNFMIPRLSDMLDYPPYLEESLRDLREQVDAFGIITNAPGGSREELFNEKPEIEELFDVIITGDDGHPQKPSPVPIFVALNKLKIPPSNKVALAGDSSKTDGGAARAAEIQFYHIANYEEPDPTANLVVPNIHDLSVALGGMNRAISSIRRY
jgi:phosphoglycolate phosphatase-like HAD superfamily hydrolase